MSMIVRVNVVLNRTAVDSDLTSDGDLTQDFLCLIQALYLSLLLTTGQGWCYFLKWVNDVVKRSCFQRSNKDSFFKRSRKINGLSLLTGKLDLPWANYYFSYYLPSLQLCSWITGLPKKMTKSKNVSHEIFKNQFYLEQLWMPVINLSPSCSHTKGP